jgi:pyruvate formate lyase activating enzyme
MGKEQVMDTETQGVVFNVQSYSIHDGPGIRTVVFLKGCPLSCLWCSNPESQNPRPELGVSNTLCKACGSCVERCPQHAISISEDGKGRIDRSLCVRCGQCEQYCPYHARKLYGKMYTPSELVLRIEKDMPFFLRSGGGVTFSGGEPTMQHGFLLKVLQECRRRFIHTAVETCGYITERERVDQLLASLDLFLYDIKCMDSERHRRFTGVPNELILDNARYVASSDADMIVRVPVIPGFNDTEEDMHSIASFVLSLLSVKRVNLLPYHELGRSKYGMFDRAYSLKGGEELSENRVETLRQVIQSAGLACDID